MIHSCCSEEDDAWLAETLDVSGTNTLADTETKARDAARELAAQVTKIMRQAPSQTLDEFVRWMDLGDREVARFTASFPDPDQRRSLVQWSALPRTTTNA